MRPLTVKPFHLCWMVVRWGTASGYTSSAAIAPTGASGGPTGFDRGRRFQGRI